MQSVLKTWGCIASVVDVMDHWGSCGLEAGHGVGCVPCGPVPAYGRPHTDPIAVEACEGR